MIKQLRKLWRIFSKERKRQFYTLLSSMAIASIFEIISLGSILPFLGALLSPEDILKYSISKKLIGYFSIDGQNQLIAIAAGCFIFAAITAGIFRLYLLYSINKFSFAVGADLSSEIYKKTLCKPFYKHALNNTSEVISSVTSRTNTVIFNIVLNSQIFLSSCILLLLISTALVIIEPEISVISFVTFALIYVGIARYTRTFIRIDSEIISSESAKSLQALQEGLGGIRDVILNGTQEYFYSIYKKADSAIRRSQARVQFIIGSPRYIVEALGMTLIAILVIFLTKRDGGVASTIPLLGVLVMGAQRMLPLLQQIYSSYSAMRAGQASLREILKLLGEESQLEFDGACKKMKFESSIEFSKLGFSYSGKFLAPVLIGVDLKISKGERIGIVGETGSGKSTLTDLLMGLLEPTSGSIMVDGIPLNTQNIRSWQNIVAHVPQNIYLSDSSIEENIAFGESTEAIDKTLVRDAANKAQLSELIDSWPDGYQTMVGENGARLSGGQRQRIAIARALYKKAKVIIFDEATSALDESTESAVIKSIYEINAEITIILIAHRTSTLIECDTIFEIINGQIVKKLDF